MRPLLASADFRSLTSKVFELESFELRLSKKRLMKLKSSESTIIGSSLKS